MPILPRNILIGFLFTIFWASASVAAKIGLHSAEPLVLYSYRFLLAGVVLLAYVYAIDRSRLPAGKEWWQLTVFGAFNTTIYLGLFIVALEYVTPGITTLALALNPLFISIMTALWMRRRIRGVEWVSIVLGIAGVIVAAYPMLAHSSATVSGLAVLAVSMVAYSFGSVYYAAVTWELSRTSINAWQVFIGGILILPVTWVMHERPTQFDLTFWGSLVWLVFPVSILAVQLWLRLLKIDAVRAALWLYLCPVFGFAYAAILLDEPFTLYTVAGTALVILALYLGQRKPKNLR